MATARTSTTRTPNPSHDRQPDPSDSEPIPDPWLARAIALAERDPYPLPACAARWLTPHDDDEPLRGVELFALPSHSQPGRTHLVRYQRATGTYRCCSVDEALETLADVAYSGARVLDTGDLCGCIAGAYGRPCRHVGATALWIRQREYALSEAGQHSQREYLEFADWLERRGY